MVHGFGTEMATIRRCMRGTDDPSDLRLEPVCNDCKLFRACPLLAHRTRPAAIEPEVDTYA